MRRLPSTTLVVLASAVFTVAVAAMLAMAAAALAIIGVGLLLGWLLFTLWPWAVLPAGIIGSAIASGLLGITDLRMIVVMHSLPLVAGYLALATRRLFGYGPAGGEQGHRHPGVVLTMVGLATAAVYGLAVGNATMNVVVASYQIAVIPVYFFMALYTLDTPHRRTCAGVLFLAAITALTAVNFVTPGRHGGLLSLLAVPALMEMAGRAGGWRRAGLALLAAGLSADVILSSYRGIWVAGGVALLVLLARGGRSVRAGVLTTSLTAAIGVVLFTFLGLSSALRGRSSVVFDAFERSAGYRVPEAEIGLGVFVSKPLLGAGLGQTTERVYLPGFAITDVGPVYHAFYVLILANLGLIGLFAVAWPILSAVRAGLRERDGTALAFAALTCGFLANAFVSSPTDGHWELGLFPALIVLTCRRGVPAARPPSRWTHTPFAVPAAGLR